MAYRYETIDVRIKRRTLWVGSQVYPLQQVTRIRTVEEIIDHGSLAWNFARTVGKTLFGGLLALIVVASTYPTQAFPQMLVLAGMVTLLGWQTYRFVKDVRRARLHLIIIETAGTAHTAIASPNRATIADLADKITEAIDNPAVNYAVKIDVVQGDQFNLSGTGHTVIN